MNNIVTHDPPERGRPRFLIAALLSPLAGGGGVIMLQLSPLGGQGAAGVGPILLFLMGTAVVALSLLAGLALALMSLIKRERLRWLAGLAAAGYILVVLGGLAWLLGWRY